VDIVNLVKLLVELRAPDYGKSGAAIGINRAEGIIHALVCVVTLQLTTNARTSRSDTTLHLWVFRIALFTEVALNDAVSAARTVKWETRNGGIASFINPWTLSVRVLALKGIVDACWRKVLLSKRLKLSNRVAHRTVSVDAFDILTVDAEWGTTLAL
jgi:hypothetical protein